MWFKNLGIYLVKDFQADDMDLHERAKAQQFEPCKPHEDAKFGWISPFGPESENYAPSANGVVALTVQFENRPVSNSQIKMILDEEIAKLKASDPDVKITNKLKKSMKEDIKAELQPKAPSNVSSITGFIDIKSGFLYVDGSPSKCEKFVGALRLLHADMDLDVEPVQTQEDPKEVMTSWLLGEQSEEEQESENAPKFFEMPSLLSVGNAFTLKDHSDGSEITYKKANSYTDDQLKKYLSDTKRVVKLKLDYEEEITLCISDDFHISGIDWGEGLNEEAQSDYAQIDSATPDEIGAAILGVMANKSKEIADFLIDECFGGIKEEDLDNSAEGGQE